MGVMRGGEKAGRRKRMDGRNNGLYYLRRTLGASANDWQSPKGAGTDLTAPGDTSRVIEEHGGKGTIEGKKNPRYVLQGRCKLPGAGDGFHFVERPEVA